MDDKLPIVPVEPEDVHKIKEKKKLAGLGGILVVFAALMLVGSSVSLNSMMKVKSVSELFSSVSSHRITVEKTLIAFRIVTAIMIALAFLQLIFNIIYTAAVIKEKVEMIFRLNGIYSLVMVFSACCFWVMTLAILGSRIRHHSGGFAPIVFFFVGIVHTCIYLKIFTSIQAQKFPPEEEKSPETGFPSAGFNV